MTNVPNLRLGEEVLAGRRLEDLVIDDEDDHLQQERQPADGRRRISLASTHLGDTS